MITTTPFYFINNKEFDVDVYLLMKVKDYDNHTDEVTLYFRYRFDFQIKEWKYDNWCELTDNYYRSYYFKTKFIKNSNIIDIPLNSKSIKLCDSIKSNEKFHDTITTYLNSLPTEPKTFHDVQNVMSHDINFGLSLPDLKEFEI